MRRNELDVHAEAGQGTKWGPRRLWFAGGAGILIVAFAVWTLAGIHVDGPLDWQHAGYSSACAKEPLDEAGDLTLALGIGKDLPFRAQGARLIGAKNVTLAGAYIGVLFPGAKDGVYRLPPLAAGWPALEGGTISSSSLTPLAGATLDRSSQHALVLRLHVDDPKSDASFKDVGLLYRSGPIRHEKRLEYGQRLVAGGTCP